MPWAAPLPPALAFSAGKDVLACAAAAVAAAAAAAALATDEMAAVSARACCCRLQFSIVSTPDHGELTSCKQITQVVFLQQRVPASAARHYKTCCWHMGRPDVCNDYPLPGSMETMSASSPRMTVLATPQGLARTHNILYRGMGVFDDYLYSRAAETLPAERLRFAEAALALSLVA